jgi:hypothetical protein
MSSLLAESSEAIDQFVSALTQSRYFDAAKQYQVNPPVFVGHDATVTVCADAAIAAGMGYTALSNFIICHFSGEHHHQSGCAKSKSVCTAADLRHIKGLRVSLIRWDD